MTSYSPTNQVVTRVNYIFSNTPKFQYTMEFAGIEQTCDQYGFTINAFDTGIGGNNHDVGVYLYGAYPSNITVTTVGGNCPLRVCCLFIAGQHPCCCEGFDTYILVYDGCGWEYPEEGYWPVRPTGALLYSNDDYPVPGGDGKASQVSFHLPQGKGVTIVIEMASDALNVCATYLKPRIEVEWWFPEPS